MRKIGINSLNVWWNSPVKLSVPDFVCVGGEVCHYQFNLIIGLSGFLCLLDSVLVDCVFLGIYSFLLDNPIVGS